MDHLPTTASDSCNLHINEGRDTTTTSTSIHRRDLKDIDLGGDSTNLVDHNSSTKIVEKVLTARHGTFMETALLEQVDELRKMVRARDLAMVEQRARHVREKITLQEQCHYLESSPCFCKETAELLGWTPQSRKPISSVSISPSMSLTSLKQVSLPSPERCGSPSNRIFPHHDDIILQQSVHGYSTPPSPLNRGLDNLSEEEAAESVGGVPQKHGVSEDASLPAKPSTDDAETGAHSTRETSARLRIACRKCECLQEGVNNLRVELALAEIEVVALRRAILHLETFGHLKPDHTDIPAGLSNTKRGRGVMGPSQAGSVLLPRPGQEKQRTSILVEELLQIEDLANLMAERSQDQMSYLKCDKQTIHIDCDVMGEPQEESVADSLVSAVEHHAHHLQKMANCRILQAEAESDLRSARHKLEALLPELNDPHINPGALLFYQEAGALPLPTTGGKNAGHQQDTEGRGKGGGVHVKESRQAQADMGDILKRKEAGEITRPMVRHGDKILCKEASRFSAIEGSRGLTGSCTWEDCSIAALNPVPPALLVPSKAKTTYMPQEQVGYTNRSFRGSELVLPGGQTKVEGKGSYHYVQEEKLSCLQASEVQSGDHALNSFSENWPCLGGGSSPCTSAELSIEAVESRACGNSLKNSALMHSNVEGEEFSAPSYIGYTTWELAQDQDNLRGEMEIVPDGLKPGLEIESTSTSKMVEGMIGREEEISNPDPCTSLGKELVLDSTIHEVDHSGIDSVCMATRQREDIGSGGCTRELLSQLSVPAGPFCDFSSYGYQGADGEKRAKLQGKDEACSTHPSQSSLNGLLSEVDKLRSEKAELEDTLAHLNVAAAQLYLVEYKYMRSKFKQIQRFILGSSAGASSTEAIALVEDSDRLLSTLEKTVLNFFRRRVGGHTGASFFPDGLARMLTLMGQAKKTRGSQTSSHSIHTIGNGEGGNGTWLDIGRRDIGVQVAGGIDADDESLMEQQVYTLLGKVDITLKSRQEKVAAYRRDVEDGAKEARALIAAVAVQHKQCQHRQDTPRTTRGDAAQQSKSSPVVLENQGKMLHKAMPWLVLLLTMFPLLLHHSRLISTLRAPRPALTPSDLILSAEEIIDKVKDADQAGPSRHSPHAPTIAEESLLTLATEIVAAVEEEQKQSDVSALCLRVAQCVNGIGYIGKGRGAKEDKGGDHIKEGWTCGELARPSAGVPPLIWGMVLHLVGKLAWGLQAVVEARAFEREIADANLLVAVTFGFSAGSGNGFGLFCPPGNPFQGVGPRHLRPSSGEVQDSSLLGSGGSMPVGWVAANYSEYKNIRGWGGEGVVGKATSRESGPTLTNDWGDGKGKHSNTESKSRSGDGHSKKKVERSNQHKSRNRFTTGCIITLGDGSCPPAETQAAARYQQVPSSSRVTRVQGEGQHQAADPPENRRLGNAEALIEVAASTSVRPSPLHVCPAPTGLSCGRPATAPRAVKLQVELSNNPNYVPHRPQSAHTKIQVEVHEREHSRKEGHPDLGVENPPILPPSQGFICTRRPSSAGSNRWQTVEARCWAPSTLRPAAFRSRPRTRKKQEIALDGVDHLPYSKSPRESTGKDSHFPGKAAKGQVKGPQDVYKGQIAKGCKSGGQIDMSPLLEEANLLTGTGQQVFFGAWKPEDAPLGLKDKE